MREEIFQYVKKKYKVEPDYPFSTAPTYPVLRHKDNRKWFALIMDIPREKFYGYHITRSNWISILLDGTVPFEEICQWIDESYAVTASRKKKGKK